MGTGAEGSGMGEAAREVSVGVPVRGVFKGVTRLSLDSSPPLGVEEPRVDRGLEHGSGVVVAGVVVGVDSVI